MGPIHPKIGSLIFEKLGEEGLARFNQYIENLDASLLPPLFRAALVETNHSENEQYTEKLTEVFQSGLIVAPLNGCQPALGMRNESSCRRLVRFSAGTSTLNKTDVDASKPCELVPLGCTMLVDAASCRVGPL